jgi:hypothetical protein
MLTVGNDAAEVERQLAAGELECPECGGRLGGWGCGRERPVRQAAGAGDVRVRPRRTRCGCGRTQVLLPAGMLARRADCAAVIGQALEQAAAGAGHRAIGAALGRPAATVRGWLRAFRRAAALIREAFTALACALDPDPLLPGPAGSPLADAVAAIAAAAVAAARRWPARVPAWELASAVTGGLLLAPGGAEMINTSRP